MYRALILYSIVMLVQCSMVVGWLIRSFSIQKNGLFCSCKKVNWSKNSKKFAPSQKSSERLDEPPWRHMVCDMLCHVQCGDSAWCDVQYWALDCDCWSMSNPRLLSVYWLLDSLIEHESSVLSAELSLLKTTKSLERMFLKDGRLFGSSSQHSSINLRIVGHGISFSRSSFVLIGP